MLLKTEAAYGVLQSSLNVPGPLLSALDKGGLPSVGGQLCAVFVGIIINKL